MPGSGIRESEARQASIGEAEFVWIDEPSSSEAPAMASSDPPLVLIHGFTGHRDDFSEIAFDLAKRRRVIAPDLRGHGDSVDVPGAYGWTFEQMVKDLLGLLDHLEIDRCDLVGHSMGGMLTLRFALAYPERIRSLVFMCSAPELPASLSRKGFETGAEIAAAHGIDRLQELMEKVGRENCSDSIASWGERYWPHHRRRLRAMTPESFHGIGSAFFDSGSLVERLQEIEAPTLVIVGEHDLDFMPGADLFEQHIRHATRVTIADAEHHPHQENKEAWQEAVEAHLDDLSS